MKTVAMLVAALRQYQLLQPAQLAEVMSKIAPSFTDPKQLARELLARKWLTPFQANLLFKGRGDELILGGYVFIDHLGEGGMGQVYKARQTKMGRVVALKVIRKERLANPDAVRRFMREIQSAAQLNHPNVVRAFDAASVGDTYFFEMELVEGADLSKRVKLKGPLPVRDACDLMRQAALGLQHAHERGLIHRDIKPANLLVTHKDKVLKILDMGLARPNLEEEGGSTLTQEGSIMGTPDYIAPEQARDATKADIRSDIYSLGCTFYFLLTGRVPFPGGTLTEKLLKHQMDSPTPISELRQDVPPVVVDVINCMMAKKPEDRFQTPGDLAAILSDVLQGNTTLAAGRSGVKLSGPLPVVPATPTPTPMPGFLPGDPFADLDRLETQVASDTPSKIAVPRKAPPRQPSPVLSKINTLLAPAAKKVGLGPEKAWLLPVGGAFLLIVLIVVGSLLFRGGGTGKSDARQTGDKKPWEVASAWDRLDSTKMPLTEPLNQLPQEVVAILGEHRGRHPGGMQRMALSPNGKMLVSGGPDGKIRLWDAESLVQYASVPAHAGSVQDFSFAANNAKLATIGNDGWVKVWAIAPKLLRELAKVNAHTAQGLAIAISPDGKMMASGGGDKVLILWDLTTTPMEKKAELKTGKDAIWSLAWSPDSKTIAVAGDTRVLLYSVAAAKPKLAQALPEPAARVSSVAFSPDGAVLVAGLQDARLLAWDLSEPKAKLIPNTPTANGEIFQIAFAPKTNQLVCACNNPEFQLFQVQKEKLDLLLRVPTKQGYVRSAGFFPNNRIMTAGGDATLRIWDTSSGRGEDKSGLIGHPGPVAALAVSPDGRWLASAGGQSDDNVNLWELGSAEAQLKTITSAPFNAFSLAFSPTSKTLAAGCSSNVALLWDMSQLEAKPQAIAGHNGTVTAVAFRQDGKTLATGDASKVYLLDPAQKRPPQILDGHGAQITGLSFMPPSGSQLASSSHDNKINIWDPFKLPPLLKTISGHTNPVFGVQFAADGKAVFSCSADGTVKAWDPVDGNETQMTFKGISGPVVCLAASPDGNALAAADQNGKVVLWQLNSTKTRSFTFPVPVQAIVFAPDCRHLAVGTANSVTYILRLTDSQKTAAK